jgi:hypothetical protein
MAEVTKMERKRLKPHVKEIAHTRLEGGSAHAGETVKGEARERCIQVYVAYSVDSPLP